MVIPNLRLPALLATSLLLLAGSALASSPLLEIKDLKHPVAAGSPTTYADLLKLVFSERTKGQEEEPQTPPVRSLNDYFKVTAKQGYGDVLALPIKDQGRPLLLLFVSAIGEQVEDVGDPLPEPIPAPPGRIHLNPRACWRFANFPADATAGGICTAAPIPSG